MRKQLLSEAEQSGRRRRQRARLAEQRRARIDEMLCALGNSQITVTEFWRLMAQDNFVNADIDKFLRGEPV
jgi:hypothetical protein